MVGSGAAPRRLVAAGTLAGSALVADGVDLPALAATALASALGSAAFGTAGAAVLAPALAPAAGAGVAWWRFSPAPLESDAERAFWSSAFEGPQGEAVDLASWRGKPLLVSFIYTGCFQVCPAQTRALYEAAKGLDIMLGEHQFNVVSIGFNHHWSGWCVP